MKVESSTCPVSRSTTRSFTTDTAVIYLHNVILTNQDVKKYGLAHEEHIIKQIISMGYGNAENLKKDLLWNSAST